MTVREALRRAAQRLAAAGVRSPEFDAGLLLRTAAGWSAAELAAADRLPSDGSEAFESLIRERAARRPLQHLTGRVEFFGLTLAVGPEALIPRPDTETLVAAALAREPRAVADVGCGSGAVALALAANLPAAAVFALDNSRSALALAARNARQTGLGVRIVASDLLTAFGGRSLDLVVANLPYIPEPEIARLEPEVRDHEPREALAGGPDGLDPLRRLAPMAARVLRPGGEILVEIAAGQRELATAILEAAGFRPVEAYADLAGIPRVLAAPR